ncbi:PKD domain-containing protein [Neolewinella agarilytica]|uniref:Por secretion system C-terminal sorting domain-containing protein n=1 Tax=Neolewinella agarilytica TaxID=478744 RepID=A0A1H9C2L2_9BACT|nr:PKD domain-containing protein [Neolewinella agarilytica]SEP95476.1 Por secretion system C-terminal sorting domain-containing protein [Neolewinella agarilytica]
MKHTYRLLLVVFLLCGGLWGLQAQQFDFPVDTICADLGSDLVIDLVKDDVPAGISYITDRIETPCYRVTEQGVFILNPDGSEERCCGPQEPFEVGVYFRNEDGGRGELLGFQLVDLTIKCPKPDCGLIDLEEFSGDNSTGEPGQNPPTCISACEFSTATYLFDQSMGLTYVWSVSPAAAGTVNYNPGLPGQLQVAWEDISPASLSVDILDGAGNIIQTRTWCVELTPSPIADFTAVTDACLGQDVSFNNTSTGAPATFDWDFGDGNTVQNVTNPTHSYDNPGTYTVTLYATSEGTNPDGSQACCCTDSVSYDITIDPLPGPGIFWISTLCEGDVSKYWTDATNCGSLVWGISPNGTITSGQGTDTIMVQWGAGPAGTLSLAVTGCDIPYCPYPTEVTVPIISSVGTISGPTEVCKGASASYELPKWMTTEYEWALPDGGFFNGPATGHIVNVTWPTVPGTYTLVGEYGSSFLAGLPNHEGDDCYGRAELTVTVLGDFDITGPTQICVNNMVTYSAFGDFAGATFNWYIDGFPAFDQTGSSSYIVDWSLLPGPGAYVITAEADTPGPADYCVSKQSIVVIVSEAVTPAISGPSDYCVNEPVVFTIASPTPGYSYFWTVSPGNVLIGNGGPTITAAFTSTTGGTVTAYGQMNVAPFCQSEVASVTLSSKEFTANPQINNIPSCTNSLAVYGITEAQDPATTYEWSISPATLGSVVSDGDTATPTIQWNNDPGSATITLVMTLCGQTRTLTQNITLTAPTVPVITQTGTLCPGGSVTLSINGALFSSQSWNTGAATPSITVTTEGIYVVNTVDLNGCPGVASYRVNEVDGPPISINTFDRRQHCVDDTPVPPPSVLTASTDPANTIEWFCNGISQGPAATGNTTFSHTFNATISGYTYVAVATDPAGCTETSDPIFIIHERCCGDPYVSDPISQIHEYTATQRMPDCDIYDLVAVYSGDSVVCHGWDLPYQTQILGSGGDNDPDRDSLTIRLPGVGCYDVDSEIFVYSYKTETTTVIDANGNPQQVTTIDTIKCGRELRIKICNPLLADFDYTEDCGKVNFADEGQVDFSLTSGPVTYTWDFGDGSPAGSGPNPMHTYAANGSYTVTLTVSDGTCQSVSVQTVTVSNLPDSDFTFNPTMVCYGEPATFTGTGTNVISWFWDFGDGATFSGNGPQHTWLPASAPANYTVTLTTENSAGCTQTITKTITVNPSPNDDVIAASNGLIICDGDDTDLSVLPQAGATYEWSTGATTNVITVSTAGTYDVTITTSDGCERVIDAVEVQVVPLPDISWSGNPFICDNGSTTLKALAGGGHTYSWLDASTGMTGSGMTFQVDYHPSAPVHDIILKVTNAYLCTSETTIQVEQVISPTPVLTVTGGLCEGDGSLIQVTNPQTDVVYTWNTGETGLSIFTYQAGVYTVLATNTITGCTGSDAVTIYPLPDICIVPTGCYETCAPDTLHGPAGDYTYAWYKNGSLVGTDMDLIVNMSASYSVVVTDNVTGCFSVSDSLYLEVIDCDSTDCDDLVTIVKEYTQDNPTRDCCYELSYTGLPNGVYAIEITSTDANLTAIPGSENPFFGYVGMPDASTIQLASDGGLSTPLPTDMNVQSALAFCPSNATNNPQTILIQYLDADLQVICEEEIITECPAEPDCIYVTTDTLYCSPDGGLILDFTVCVPSDLTFNIGYIQLQDASAEAGVDLPIGIPLSPAMIPGECRSLSINLSELVPGEEFCYKLVGHSGDPAIDPSALCCSDQEPRCLDIPFCDPCEDLAVDIATADDEGCCFDIFLVDNATFADFDAIDLCIIDGDGTLSVFGNLGDPIVGSVNTGGTTATFVPAGGGLLPDGFFQLPRICIDDNTVRDHTIEIKWMKDGEVICRDTVMAECDPPCGYLTEDTIVCEGDQYVWSGLITNTSDHPMSQAYISFDDPALAAYNTTIVFGSVLNTGDSESININIGAPASPGEEICFTVTLHELNDEDDHLNCCHFEVCITMPDCEISQPCSCDDDDFEALVAQGFSVNLVGPSAFDYELLPKADFRECDVFRWRVRRVNPSTGWQVVGTQENQLYTFPGNFDYRIQMIVTRTADNGEVCQSFRYRSLDLREAVSSRPTFEVFSYPNPTDDELFLEISGQLEGATVTNLQIFTIDGRPLQTFQTKALQTGSLEALRLNVSDLKPGAYLIRGENAGTTWTHRFIKR